MMYISTDYVFDGKGEKPWEPDCTDYAPLNVYGESKLAGEKAGYRIENGEEAGNCAIVGIGPMELGLNELVICEREHLTVEIINRRGDKKQRAKPPAPGGH